MKKFLMDLKPLRAGLLLVVIISLIFKPEPGTTPVYEGAEVFSTLLIPVFSPILVMLLWLDAIIAKVWQTQTEGEESARYRMIARINLVLSLVFLGAWIPYFSALL